MTQNQMRRYKYIMAGLGGGLIFAVLLAVDLFTKAWAEWYEIAYGLSQPSYFLGIVRLTYTQNRGIAFGIASDDPLIMSIIIAVTVLLALLLIVAFFTIFRNNMPVRICLATVEAGAVGNIVDRLVLGYVRDFLDVRPLGFGICNIADRVRRDRACVHHSLHRQKRRVPAHKEVARTGEEGGRGA